MSTAPPGERRAILLAAVKEAFGPPGVILAASFVGFGSLVRESDLSLWVGLASTVLIWALPGQVVMAELYAVGASLLVVGAAVLLTNARLLPMTVTLLPWLRGPGVPAWKLYLAGHFVAVTAWANSMRLVPTLPERQRLAWFYTFAGTLWALSILGTAVGYHLAAAVPQPVTLALVFLNPVYFLLLLIGDLSQRPKVIAMAAGAILGPLFHMLDPDWGLLLTGLVAGSVGFAAGYRRDKGGGNA